MVLISLKDQLRELLKPSLLLKVHNLVFPFPKASQLDWQVAFDNNWAPKLDRLKTLYELLFPVWLAMSKMPLDELKKMSMLEFLPEHTASDYLEQCSGLVWILDQQRIYFTGTDVRYTRSFFDPLAEKLASELFDEQGAESGVPSASSPFHKEVWLAKGWTFEDYVVRVIWIWTPLIHSERFMHERWTTNKAFIDSLCSEVESYSNRLDPHRRTEAEDEKDLLLFSDMLKGADGKGRPTKETLGRDLEMSDCLFWILRILLAHWPIIHRFGRYPYSNDQMGRDFAQGELEWIESTGFSGFQRIPENDRKLIRQDVENGTWTSFKGNTDFE